MRTVIAAALLALSAGTAMPVRLLVHIANELHEILYIVQGIGRARIGGLAVIGDSNQMKALVHIEVASAERSPLEE